MAVPRVPIKYHCARNYGTIALIPASRLNLSLYLSGIASERDVWGCDMAEVVAVLAVVLMPMPMPYY
jgi:hypothetical protein